MLVVLAVASAVASPASSAPGFIAPTGRGEVHIFKLSEKVAPYAGRVKVKPPVDWWGNARILSKKMTVSADGRTLVRNAPSVRLPPGRYELKTKVRYQTWKLTNKTFALPAGTVVHQSNTNGTDPIRVVFSGCPVTW